MLLLFLKNTTRPVSRSLRRVAPRFASFVSLIYAKLRLHFVSLRMTHIGLILCKCYSMPPFTQGSLSDTRFIVRLNIILAIMLYKAFPRREASSCICIKNGRSKPLPYRTNAYLSALCQPKPQNRLKVFESWGCGGRKAFLKKFSSPT